jgi:hypothetical protein
MDDVEALSTIVGVLKQLEPNVQRRVLESVQAFLGISTQPHPHAHGGHKPQPGAPSFSSIATDFSRDRTLSPKEFLRDKHPVTDADRVTCLAYYLAHYRDTPHFKTVDISALNTEAAQPKFSNASVALDNATRDGYLVAAARATKQISAAGEKYVELLPDRDAAREAMRSFRTKRVVRKRRTKAT